MDKRIKELALQAGVNLSSFQFSGTLIKYEVSESDLEYFAELIVRECVGILDDEDDYGPCSTGVRSAAYRIKKRFGVDEKIRERGTT